MCVCEAIRRLISKWRPKKAEPMERTEAPPEPVTHIVLACDESGEKGYANATDTETDEIGVFAGIMVPAELLPKVASEFDAAVRPFASPDGKLHITDLKPEDQAALRNTVYALI